MSKFRLNLVVAAGNNSGIGKNGQLPWKIRKDMNFFKKITSETQNADKCNAVIMGRKTWFSIPEKFRPLKGRVNIVLSRDLKEVPTGVYIARSLPEAVALVQSGDIPTTIEDVYIIGGSSVYKEAMCGSYNCRIYLTRVLADFDCDTFLPDIDEHVFQKIDNPQNVPTELQEENGVKFRFEVYDKTHETKSFTAQQPIQFNIMVAMCHENRGIGNNGGLPWPSLKHDFEYYTKKTTTHSDPSSGAGDMGNKKHIVHIRGRKTYGEGQAEERQYLKNIKHIVVSKTFTQSASVHSNVLAVVPTFDEAVLYCNRSDTAPYIDSVWVMGGSHIYKEALQHELCNRLYVTHIYKDFPADTFFPTFESSFSEVTAGKTEQHEENGVKYEFKVYKRSR